MSSSEKTSSSDEESFSSSSDSGHADSELSTSSSEEESSSSSSNEDSDTSREPKSSSDGESSSSSSDEDRFSTKANAGSSNEESSSSSSDDGNDPVPRCYKPSKIIQARHYWTILSEEQMGLFMTLCPHLQEHVLRARRTIPAAPYDTEAISLEACRNLYALKVSKLSILFEISPIATARALTESKDATPSKVSSLQNKLAKASTRIGILDKIIEKADDEGRSEDAKECRVKRRELLASFHGAHLCPAVLLFNAHPTGS